MNQNIFINEALSEGINNYINKIKPDDFVTIIIKTLVSIYGELDIINPYKTHTESGLGGFDENITKFGYSKENLVLFKENVLNFYLEQEKQPNKYFNKIEKDLIDMFFLKRKSIDNDKINIEEFKSLLQFENSNLNIIYSTDNQEIRRYYNFKEKMASSNIEYNILENNTLDKQAYEILGYSYDNVINMSEDQIIDINNKIFEYFKIDTQKEDKYIRLEQAIEYYKEFNSTEKEKQENGYVEFLLLSGFVAISLLIITIVVGVLAR